MSIKILLNELRVTPPQFNRYISDWRPGLKAIEAVQQSLPSSVTRRVLEDLESNDPEITVSWLNDDLDQRSEVGGVGSLDWEIPDKSILVIAYENENTGVDAINEAISWMAKDEENTW